MTDQPIDALASIPPEDPDFDEQEALAAPVENVEPGDLTDQQITEA